MILFDIVPFCCYFPWAFLFSFFNGWNVFWTTISLHDLMRNNVGLRWFCLITITNQRLACYNGGNMSFEMAIINGFCFIWVSVFFFLFIYLFLFFAGWVGADTEMLVLDTKPSAMMIVDWYSNDSSIKIRESLNTTAARPKIKSMVPSMVHCLWIWVPLDGILVYRKVTFIECNIKGRKLILLQPDAVSYYNNIKCNVQRKLDFFLPVIFSTPFGKLYKRPNQFKKIGYFTSCDYNNKFAGW